MYLRVKLEIQGDTHSFFSAICGELRRRRSLCWCKRQSHMVNLARQRAPHDRVVARPVSGRRSYKTLLSAHPHPTLIDTPITTAMATIELKRTGQKACTIMPLRIRLIVAQYTIDAFGWVCLLTISCRAVSLNFSCAHSRFGLWKVPFNAHGLCLCSIC